MAPNGTLSATQQSAAVLLASGHTQQQTADAAGCGRRTVARWVAEVPAFGALVAQLRAEQLEAATGVLVANAADLAGRVVAMALEASSLAPRDRLNACIRGLTLARDFHHGSTIEARLRAIEDSIGGTRR